MRCKNCDYTLWNIKARECPECGSAFKPSDFTFTLNAVRYCCPHCQQDYYGTGPQGELVPRSFICVSCARPIDMDEMVLLPTEGVSEEITQPDVMPWLERRKIGFLRGFFGTIVRAMGSPGRLIKMVPEDHPPTHAFIFAALANVLYFGIGLSPFLLVMLIPMLAVGGQGGIRGAAATAGGTAGSVLATFAFVMVAIIAWGASAHVVLKVSGVTRCGMGRTYHAICYSSGANALVAIPCFGPYFFFIFSIWWVVSAIVMLKEAQGVSAGRAVAAVLALPLLLISLGVLAIMGLVIASNNGAFGSGPQQSWSMTPPPPPAPPASDLTTPLGRANEVMISVLDARSNNLAFHPAELLRFPLGESLLPGTSELAGGLSGAEIDQLDTEPTEAIVEAVIKAQPAASVQRFGDFVFVHRGLPADQFGNSPLDAWVFILAPKAESLPDTIHVGVAGGGILSMTRADFLDQLDLENQRRAGWGIEPITAPNEVGQ